MQRKITIYVNKDAVSEDDVLVVEEVLKLLRQGYRSGYNPRWESEDVGINDDEWLIWSNEHQGWWAKDERGYTKNKNEAGRYSFEKACRLVERANYHLTIQDEPNETMVKA